MNRPLVSLLAREAGERFCRAGIKNRVVQDTDLAGKNPGVDLLRFGGASSSLTSYE